MVELNTQQKPNGFPGRTAAGWKGPNGGCYAIGTGSEVHVFCFSLRAGDSELAEFIETLSEDEIARAERFHFECHRRRYIVGRATLRRIVAGWVEIDPALLEFTYGATGKPALGGKPAESGIEFNLAHCEDLAVVAITRDAEVGIDLERVRFLPDFKELVARFFSRRESERFENLPAELKPCAFFNLWTRKEALLKATGEGIGHCLSQVEVTFLPGEPVRFLSLPRHVGALTEWRLKDLPIEQGYAAGLAWRSKSAK
jgi:4'-phosphopantetheinyl transferase